MMICFRETTFWAKRSLSFVFRGPNTVHPEVFRQANHNGTSSKAVWWPVSEKLHFELKDHFPLYLEGQTQCTLRFSGIPIIMVQVVKCMMTCFRETTFWAKTSLTFVFRGPNSVQPEILRCANWNGTNFKPVSWSVSEKPHFGLKDSISFVFRGPNSVHTDIFRCAKHNDTDFTSCMMTCFWEKTFWAKTLPSFVFRGPNSVHLKVFSCANHNGTDFKAVWWFVC